MSTTDPSHTTRRHRPRRQQTRIHRLALAAMAACLAALGTPGTAWASGTVPHATSPLAACMSQIHASPDALEGWVDYCQDRARQVMITVADDSDSEDAR
jgi:hypothetical protein